MILSRKSCCSVAACALAWALSTGVSAAINEASQDYYHYYEDAVARFGAGEYSAAIIQLKNVLQRNPGHVPSRILLGRAHLRSGHAALAEKELEIALQLGADEALVLVPLGNALLLQRKHAEILKRVRSRDPASSGGVGVLSIRGQAYFELGQLDEAEGAFREAAMTAPAQSEPLLGLATVLLARGDLAEAERLVSQAERLAPESEEVWFRRAQIRVLAGDPQGALALFDRTLERAPGHMRARLARARLYMQLENYERARGDAEYILALVPEDAHAALLSAQASARLGDVANAAEAFETAARRIAVIDPDFLWRNPAALVLAGKISFVRKDYEKTNHYLSRYLSLKPAGSVIVRKLLGRARLETDAPRSALEVLEPLVRATPEDAEAQTLLGDAYLRLRMYHQAADAFERAAELAADDSTVKTRLAVSRMVTGHTEQGLAALQEAFALDSGSMRAGLLLAFIQIRRAEIDEARATAAALRERYPENPVTENLLGVVSRSAGEIDAARAAFSRALDLDEAFEPAAFNLAELELAAGNIETAIARYERILGTNPRSDRALIGLADVALSRGQTAEAVNLLEKAVALIPGAVEPYLRLVGLYLDLNRPSDALRSAKQVYYRYPENALVLRELGRAQLASGLRREAPQTLRNATRLAGYAGANLLSIGELQVSAGDYEGARWSFQKATETGYRDAANAALVRLEVTMGNLPRALELAQELKRREPDSPIGHFLVAEVMARQGRFEASIQAYEAALGRNESTEAVVGLFETMMTAGRREAAFAKLERWVERNPRDLRALRALGLGYIADGRLELAERVHSGLLKARPHDPLILNNLARMYQLKKDPRAREYAERALERAPTWPVALDTLGWILVTEGEAAKGLPLLRDAHSRASANSLIRYHLAAALSELGRNSEALAELDFLLREQGELGWIDEVRKLRDKVAQR